MGWDVETIPVPVVGAEEDMSPTLWSGAAARSRTWGRPAVPQQHPVGAGRESEPSPVAGQLQQVLAQNQRPQETT